MKQWSHLLLAPSLLAIGCTVDGFYTKPPGTDPDGPATISLVTQDLNGEVASAEFVAYQDGDGEWQEVAGNAGVFEFTISTGRYGVLTACETSDAVAYVKLGYFAVSDGKTRYLVDSCTSSSSVMIRGTISNAATSEVSISAGRGGGTPPPGTWSIAAFPGPGTLMGRRMSGGRPVGVLLVRGEFAEGATFNLDFNQQFFPAESELTLGAVNGSLSMTTSYFDEVGLRHPIDNADVVVPTYRVVPADRLGTGVSAIAFSDTSNTGGRRSIERAFRNPGAQTMTLPVPLTLSQTPRYDGFSPYPIVVAALPKRADASHYMLSYISNRTGTFKNWELTYSAAWASGTDGADLVSRMPNLGSLSGWRGTFALPDMGGTTHWTATIASGPLHRLPGNLAHGRIGNAAPPRDGDEVTTVSAGGMLPSL